MTHSPSQNRGVVVFSGGSAANSLVDVFKSTRESKNCPLSYIIPISDNGGSSSELIRFFGGPGIGDVRSRLVRLIPTEPPSPERSAIAYIFNHRLSSTSASDAHSEWLEIVSGTSPIWRDVSSAKKELIRSFLNLINMEVLKRTRPPTSTFDFTSASIGNLFLTGARLFSGSFESAIYLLSSICGVEDDHVKVIPAINTNFSHHIAAGLENGGVVVGQNNISHPSEPSALDHLNPDRSHSAYDREPEDANLPGSLPSLHRRNITFSKANDDELPARIERLWYINPYGQEIRPPANPRVITALQNAQAIIYSIGSLWTSIIPSIVLKGVGDAIKSSPAKHKILILNGSLDREVGPTPYTAADFIEAISRAAEESRGQPRPSQGTTDMIQDLARSLTPTLQPTLNGTLPDKLTYHRDYVTHVIYLEGEGVPKVDRKQLAMMGIECLRLYGRKAEGVGMRYDGIALAGAIETILGRKGDAMSTSKSRRNTLEG